MRSWRYSPKLHASGLEGRRWHTFLARPHVFTIRAVACRWPGIKHPPLRLYSNGKRAPPSRASVHAPLVDRRIGRHPRDQRIAPALAGQHLGPQLARLGGERVLAAGRLADPVAPLELGVELTRPPAGVADERAAGSDAGPGILE